MFYAFLCRHLPAWAAQAVAVVVYASLIFLMVLLANTDDAAFRYMK
jgi:hypothetical protein